MTKSTWVVLGLFAVLIVGAIAVLSFKPTKLTPMDPVVLQNSPVPLIKDESLMGAKASSLPVLAASMPDFQGISNWWNTAENRPLTKEDLKGKVVMVDFWTYSCINCIRTQPFMRKIWDAYKDDGLVIVGVHTPEFAFEKVPANVESALKKAKLEYPIALDPDYATWNTYNNRYSPAAYFFDRQGRLRFTHFGEGEYDTQEDVIRDLLQEGGALTEQPTGGIEAPDFAKTKTPETYFGSARSSGFANTAELKADTETTYQLHETKPNEWSIEGSWNISAEKAVSIKIGNRFRMNVESNAMYLVLGSIDGAKRVNIVVDGKTVDPITVEDKQLYTIARFPSGGRHTVELEILDSGVEFYAATFGE